MTTMYSFLMRTIFAGLIFIEASNSYKFNEFNFKCFTDCSRYNCRKTKDVRESCPGGLVYGVCGCCLHCAKQEGEECGAFKNAKGICDVGLYCDEGGARRKRAYRYAPGRCRRLSKLDRSLHGPFSSILENRIPHCEPNCTPKFCSMWPDAVCSARRNHEKKRACQSTCQHTTCHACYFKTKDEPPCRKCSSNDFDCLRKFGKCVKRELCTRAKYPCMAKAKRQVDGDFICKVPACEL